MGRTQPNACICVTDTCLCHWPVTGQRHCISVCTTCHAQVLSRNVRMEDAVRLERLLTHGQDLKQDERDEIMHMLCPWGTHETMAALTPAL